jgi:hypothetical protein
VAKHCRGLIDPGIEFAVNRSSLEVVAMGESFELQG